MMYAAIGSDGWREVVWGVGTTEDEAEDDAKFWLEASECGPQDLRTVPITEDQASDIWDGVVSVKALGL